jgi:hypothetical protein
MSQPARHFLLPAPNKPLPDVLVVLLDLDSFNDPENQPVILMSASGLV